LVSQELWKTKAPRVHCNIHKDNFWKEIAVEISGVICRNAKQCGERWADKVDPSINHGAFTADEDCAIAEGRLSHAPGAGSWVTIAKGLPTTTATATSHRTPNGVKNRWNCCLVKRNNKLAVTQATEARTAAEQAAKAEAEAAKAAEKAVKKAAKAKKAAKKAAR
jgi:myb proto-oncogene protein